MEECVFFDESLDFLPIVYMFCFFVLLFFKSYKRRFKMITRTLYKKKPTYDRLHILQTFLTLSLRGKI